MSVSSPGNRFSIDSSASDCPDAEMDQAMRLFANKEIETYEDLCAIDPDIIEMDCIVDAINDATIDEMESLKIFSHQ